MRRALGLFALILGGCVDLSAPAVERRFYALAVERPEPAKAGGTGVLKVRRFQVSRACEGVEFVYRASASSYESDFYHAFFTPPAAQVTDLARRWMSKAGLFAHVLDAASAAPETHLLEGNVAALHADLREAPKGVVELQLLLLTSSGEIRARKSYRRETPAASSGPDDLVAAWNQGLSEILAAAEADLAASRP